VCENQYFPEICWKRDTAFYSMIDGLFSSVLLPTKIITVLEYLLHTSVMSRRDLNIHSGPELACRILQRAVKQAISDRMNRKLQG
jgi:hypothetical protein